jgi:NADH-quinone oxidoreductase subunit G
MESAGFVVACSPFFDATLEKHADVVLPMGTFAETSGTFVNAAGQWQSFAGVAMPFGESRPGWKILRVLGNLIELPDCNYETSESIRDELMAVVGDAMPENRFSNEISTDAVAQKAAEGLDVPIYRIDSLVRRAQSLQLTRDGLGDGQNAADGRKIA